MTKLNRMGSSWVSALGLLLAACGPSAKVAMDTDAAGGESGRGPTQLAEGDFTVHVVVNRVRLDGFPDPAPYEKALDITARVQHERDSWTLVMADNGQFRPFKLESNGASWNAELSSSVAEEPRFYLGPYDEAYSEKLAFEPGALDSKGRLASFRAQGPATSYSGRGGDTPDQFPAASIELVGTTDVTPPTLELPSNAQSPLDSLMLQASEELDAAATATISDPASSVEATLAHGADDPNAPFVSFMAPPLLRFDARLSVTGRLLDLAGNSAAFRGELKTCPDPGIVTDSDFEGDIPTLYQASVTRDPALVITGKQSLVVDSPVLFHLHAVGAKKVRFDAAGNTLVVRVGAVGGTQVAEAQLDPTGITPVEVALPEPADDVMVQLDVRRGTIPLSNRCMVDGLRLE